MKTLPSVAARWSVALMLVALVPAAWGQAISCRFGNSATASFPPLNPAAAQLQSVSVSLNVGDCNSNQNMVVSIDQGLRGNRTLQRTAGTETIAYSVTTPTFAGGNAGPGNNNYKAVTFNIVIQANAYADAVAGDYTDRLIVSVTP